MIEKHLTTRLIFVFLTLFLISMSGIVFSDTFEESSVYGARLARLKSEYAFETWADTAKRQMRIDTLKGIADVLSPTLGSRIVNKDIELVKHLSIDILAEGEYSGASVRIRVYKDVGAANEAMLKSVIDQRESGSEK